MAQLIGSSLAAVGAPGEVHTSQLNPLGKRAFDTLGNEVIYLKGVASTVLGSWVNFDGGTVFETALLDTGVAATQLGRIAVASAAIVADRWGWYYVGGTLIVGNTEAGATDAKNVFSVAVAGSVDDSGAGAEVLVFNAFYVGAADTPASGKAYFALNNP